MKFNVACKGEVSLHTFPAHISFTLLTLVHLVTRISVLEQHFVCKLIFHIINTEHLFPRMMKMILLIFEGKKSMREGEN